MGSVNKNKANLLYMTGLSIDKNRMNNITENINFDKDYTYFLNGAQEDLKEIFSKKQEVLTKVKNLGCKLTIDELEDAIKNIIDIFDCWIGNKVEDKASSKIVSGITKPVKSIFKILFEQFGMVSAEEIKNNNGSLIKLLNKYEKNYSKYTNGDFFSLYMSNQSDSIGVQSLSKLSADEKYNFNISHSYCDWDYYDNKYIDHVILKVKTSKLKKNWDLELERVFNLHVNEILLSKIIQDNEIDIGNKEQEETKMKSIIDLIMKHNEIKKDDVVSMLADRNLFGISLLSQLLFTLNDLVKEEKDTKKSTETKNSNDEKSKISIKFDETKDQSNYHFLKELIQMASNPKMKINDEKDSIISAKIYTSNGIRLDKSINELKNDEYFLYTNKFENKDISDESLINATEEEIEQEISQNSIYTISKIESDDRKLVNYIYEQNGYVYLKVPIKIMLSLPIDEDDKPNCEKYLPFCLIDESKKNIIDVLTVGGAEHNRALAHLINKHRLEKTNKRLFGFVDNYFDFTYKFGLDTSQNHNLSYNFFMGINQPVSGWNFILGKRYNDSEGNSINTDVKFLTFKLKEEGQKLNIVSIYGFSAIASVLGVNMFIAEFFNRNDFKENEGLFSGKFSKYFNEKHLETDKDTTATLFFYKNLFQIYDDENKIKNDIKINLKDFEENDKKQMINDLYEGEKKYLIECLDRKKGIELIVKYSDYEKIKKEKNKYELSDIKINIKQVVKYLFKNKLYLYTFNNNIDLYSNVLHNDKMDILSTDKIKGRVSTKNEEKTPNI